jgi:hypothetical protein
LPNDGVLPTASIFTESSEEIFPAEWHFVTKLEPQVSPFPVPIFGVNTKSQRNWADGPIKEELEKMLKPHWAVLGRMQNAGITLAEVVGQYHA